MVARHDPEIAIGAEFDGVRAVFAAAGHFLDEFDLAPGVAAVVGDTVEAGLEFR